MAVSQEKDALRHGPEDPVPGGWEKWWMYAGDSTLGLRGGGRAKGNALRR